MRGETYHWDVKVIEVAPWLGLGEVDFGVVEVALVPDVGEDGFGLVAEAAVGAVEEGDADGVEEGACREHFTGVVRLRIDVINGLN